MRPRSIVMAAALGIASFGVSALPESVVLARPVQAATTPVDAPRTAEPSAAVPRGEVKTPRILDPTFTTDPGRALEVRLLLDGGKTPVSGCRIEILRESRGRRPGDGVHRKLLSVHETDARGVARFERVAPGRYVAAVGLGGAARGIVEFVTVEEGVGEIVAPIRIRGICDIVGRVESRGTGCPGFPMRLAGDVVVRTDRAGVYRFEGVAFGGASTIRVSIAHAHWYGNGDWSTSGREIPLAAGVVTVEILCFSEPPKSPLGSFAEALLKVSQPAKR